MLCDANGLARFRHKNQKEFLNLDSWFSSCGSESVAILLGVNFTLFSLFSAGGGNGIQLNFCSDEFAFCTKTYACHFCFFLNFNFTLTLNLILLHF